MMERSLLDLIYRLKQGCLEDESKIRTSCRVSVAEYKGIIEIDIKEQVTCNALSQKMGLSPSRGSRIIDGLVRKGYFTRNTNPGDRRSYVISLSSEGARVKRQIEAERRRCEARIRQRFSERQIESLKEALDLITDIFE